MNERENAHERIDRLERAVEKLSEYIALQVQINESLLKRLDKAEAALACLDAPGF